MIDTRELREDNIVSLHYGPIDVVTAIDGYSKKKTVRLAEVESWCYIEEIQPIPLTEAVLRAAGFEWDEWNQKYKINKNTKHEFAWSEERGLSFNYSICRRGIEHITSLHSLQNVYYALTGKELEINMEELKKAVG